MRSRLAWTTQHDTLFQTKIKQVKQTNKQKRVMGGGCFSARNLPSVCEALGSIPTTAKTKKVSLSVSDWNDLFKWLSVYQTWNLTKLCKSRDSNLHVHVKNAHEGWGCCSVVENLPGIYSILGLNPHTKKTKFMPVKFSRPSNVHISKNPPTVSKRSL